MTRAEGDRMAEMVLHVVREVERMQLSSGGFRGYDDTYIYVDRDVADVVYRRLSA